MEDMQLIFVITCLTVNIGLLNSLPVRDKQGQQITGIDNGLLQNDPQISPGLPPLVFPDDPRKYKIVPPNNLTALKILLHQPGMQDNGKKITSVATKEAEADSKSETGRGIHEPMEIPPQVLEEDDFKFQAESIQSEDISKQSIQLEEQFRHSSVDLRVNEVFAENIETFSTKLKDGHLVAIFVSLTFVIGLCIYAALIVWRNYLEKRYGMRERLVTQDDFENNNDLRHADL